jgi:hypothetical protein
MVFAQRTEAVIKFKDGTKKLGYGKLLGKHRIAFRENLKEKAVEYNFADCEYLDLIYKHERERFRQFPVQNEDYSVVLKEHIYGTLSLYLTSSSGYAPTAGNFGTAAGMMPGLGVSYTVNDYYLKKNTSDSVIHMGSNPIFKGKFKVKAAEFFKKCPILSYRIKNAKKGYRKRDIDNIIKYYNTKCP